MKRNIFTCHNFVYVWFGVHIKFGKIVFGSIDIGITHSKRSKFENRIC